MISIEYNKQEDIYIGEGYNTDDKEVYAEDVKLSRLVDHLIKECNPDAGVRYRLELNLNRFNQFKAGIDPMDAIWTNVSYLSPAFVEFTIPYAKKPMTYMMYGDEYKYVTIKLRPTWINGLELLFEGKLDDYLQHHAKLIKMFQSYQD